MPTTVNAPVYPVPQPPQAQPVVPPAKIVDATPVAVVLTGTRRFRSMI